MIESIVVFWLALAPAAGSAQPPPSSSEPQQADLSEAKRLFDEGSARYDAADYVGAIEVFTLALSELHGKGVDDFSIRGLLLFNIGRTHMRAYEIDEEVEHLRQAKNIFTRFVDEAEQHADQVEASDIDEAKAQMVEIDRLLADSSSEPESEPGPSNPEDRDREVKGSRGVGIGLTVAGAAVLGTGIGLLAWGPTFVPAAEVEAAKLDGLGLPPGDPAFADADAFVAAERRKGTAVMVGGGIAAAVGVVGLAFGIRELVRAKRSNPRAVAASASLGREGVWLGMRGRF